MGPYKVLTNWYLPRVVYFIGSGQTYNKLSQVCDNGEIRSKGENEEVCGSKTVYNTTVQKCCRLNETHGKVYPKGN